MKGLLRKLSALDSDAETAIRVIAFFDELVERRATPAEVLRSTAALADCVAGLDLGGQPVRRCGPDGRPPAGDPRPATASARVTDGGRVWLERPDGKRPLDDLVLERCAIALRVLGHGTATPHLADPALVELVLSEREAPEDRLRAVKLLGLSPDRPLRVAAVECDAGLAPGAEAVRLLARTGRRTPVRMALVGPAAALLLQGPLPTGAARGVRVGIGGPVDSLDARTSWAQARRALRFTSPEHPVADFTELGAPALLAEIPVEALRGNADVVALDALAATASGLLDIAAVEAFCTSGSLRKAAELLHLHHSSVAARVTKAEDALGWRLDTPHGRFRAMVAILARRLAA